MKVLFPMNTEKNYSQTVSCRKAKAETFLNFRVNENFVLPELSLT